MKLKQMLGDKPFWQVTSRLALPIALQNLLTSSFQLVDTMMVSRLGDVTLSAVGMASQWGWMSTLLGFGLCSGMSVFVSQYWGVRDTKGIRRVLGITLLFSLLISALFLSVALLLPDTVLRMFNKDPAVLAAGRSYLVVVCFSYPAVTLTNILATVLRNTEQVKAPLYVSMVTTVVNMIVNYGLIFGRLGMPELGVAGAAVATCISSWLGPVLLLAISAWKKNLLIGPVRELVAFRLHHLKEFFRRVSPVLVNEAMWSLGIVVLNMIYSNQGYEYFAGVTVFKTFGDLCFAFYVGLGNSCTIMVGKSVGQGKIARAVEDAKRFTFLLALAGFVVGSTMILCRHALVSVFTGGDNISDLAIQTALSVTVFCGIEVILRNITYVQVVGIFRSGGDTFGGMIYDLGSLWIVSIPAALLVSRIPGVPFLAVVAAAYLGEDIPKTLLCLRHFRTGKWLKPVTPEGLAGLEAYRAANGGSLRI